MSGKEQVNIQLFHRWDMSNIEINDPDLKSVINLKPAVIQSRLVGTSTSA